MPRDFGIPVNEEMISNMRGIAGVYSKGKGKKAGQSWVDDSTKKLSSATDGVVQTANFWMKDTYEKMEGLSHMD